MQALHVHADKRVTSAGLTSSVNADPASVRQVLSKLAKAGLVKTTRGRNGSCELARSAERISLLDIYRATAAPKVFAIHAHPVVKSCAISSYHKQTLADVLDDCQQAFEASLARTKLSDIVEPMQRALAG